MTMSQVLLVCSALAGATDGQEFLPRPTRIPPAALLDVSGNLINTVVERPVQTVEPVRDVVLDAQVFGTSWTRGRVSARLLCDRERAFLAIVLEGTSHSDTVGLQEADHAKAYTHTIANFEVHQPLALDARGVHVYPPAARASVRTELQCVTNLHDSTDSIVVGFGTFVFNQDRRQIEAITARKTEAKVTASFTKELRPQIDKASRALKDALSALAGLGVPMQPLRWSSTATHLHGEAGLVVAAPMTAPPALPASADLNLRLHQSVFNRMAQMDLAGKTYSALDLLGLREAISSVLNGTPKAPDAKVNPDQLKNFLKLFKLEPVAITFAKMDPVDIDLDAAGFAITLRGSSFHQGSLDYPARNIRARYRIETTAADIALVRESNVQVLAVSPNKDLDDANYKRVQADLEKAFNVFLPSRLVLPKITIPGERPIVLVPTHAATSAGWLNLGWTKSAK